MEYNYLSGYLTEIADDLISKMEHLVKQFYNFTSEHLDEEKEGEKELLTLMKEYKELTYLMEYYLMKNSVMQDTMLMNIVQISEDISEIKNKLN